jgi:hypothetical protein
MDEEPRDVRLPLMVTRSEAAAIDVWRYANHVPSRAEAIRRLIEAGLASAPPGPVQPPLRQTQFDDAGEVGEYTDLENAAYRVADFLCQRPPLGRKVSTDIADAMLALLDAAPNSFADYLREFIKNTVADHEAGSASRAAARKKAAVAKT